MSSNDDRQAVAGLDRIGSLEDLDAIKQKVTAEEKSYDHHVLVCSGTPCRAADGLEVKSAIERELSSRDFCDRVRVSECGCMGFCAVGPVMIVNPGGYFYQKVTDADVADIVEQHLQHGQPVTRLMYSENDLDAPVQTVDELPYFAGQKLLALRNGGRIDPENIEEYIARDGYRGLHKAVEEMSPFEIIQEVKESGLRGRGGGGFPTGLKWQFCSFAKGNQKYALCNADEGDPGAFMDRSILESDPHSVVEGMVIAARAIGANRGYVYCRAEYPLALKRLQKAIDQARAYGLLGEDIFDSGFDFDLEIYKGAGAFVCGEETALMRSIEGQRGTPRPRPPFPAVSGLWGKPTILNNVETYCNIPQIILHGGEEYASIGTESAHGTKVFALSGKIKHFGLVEVPMGTTIRTVVNEIAGGVPDGGKLKAVQLGGPSGGCLPEEKLDTPIDYDAICEAGAIMGSGGMVVMDQSTCMVDVARFFMEFCQDESCGKCTPCRVGTRRMLEILQRICSGHAHERDLDLLEDLAATISDASLCGLGQTASNPVLSTIRYFRDEYEAHIRERRCPAGVCRDLITYRITDECTGCLACVKKCPVGAITGEKKQVHTIDDSLCTRCGVCRSVCRFNAVEVV